MWQVWLNPGSCLRGCKFLALLYLPTLFSLPSSSGSIGMEKIATGTMSQTCATSILKATLILLATLGKNLSPYPGNEKPGYLLEVWVGKYRTWLSIFQETLSHWWMWLMNLKTKSVCIVSGYFSNNIYVYLSEWAWTMVTSGNKTR